MREKLRHPPQIGMRMVKSAAAVFLCLLLSVLWNREDMRIYSSIAALWCIRPYHGDTKKMAIQRISGTAVGTAYGALAILAELYLLPGIRGTVPGYLLIAAFILRCCGPPCGWGWRTRPTFPAWYSSASPWPI